jgi:peptidoglycan/xylan/chitin deacetylase (PgdA/CDA1 family)
MYHRIDYVTSSTPAPTKALTVSPERFRRQMRWLKLHGYHTITQRSLFNALMCGSHLRRKPIVITFDDGYRDVYRYASPVIERFGMHAISYLITERISGDDRSFLSWKQVRRFEGRGVEIGSHTVSHAALTSLSNAGAMDELVKSRKKLERKLDHRVPWLAYPYGDYDGRIEALAKKAGYKLAVTTDWGSLQSASRPFDRRKRNRGNAGRLASVEPGGGRKGRSRTTGLSAVSGRRRSIRDGPDAHRLGVEAADGGVLRRREVVRQRHLDPVELDARAGGSVHVVPVADEVERLSVSDRDLRRRLLDVGEAGSALDLRVEPAARGVEVHAGIALRDARLGRRVSDSPDGADGACGPFLGDDLDRHVLVVAEGGAGRLFAG